MGVFLVHVVPDLLLDLLPDLLYVLDILGVKMMSTIELINDELNFQIKARDFLIDELYETYCESDYDKLMNKIRRKGLIIEGLNLMKENIEKGDKNVY